MKRIVVGGGTGFVGRTLQKLLLNEGYALTIVTRSPEKVQKTDRIDAISWKDVEERGLPPCESVVQLTGELLVNPARRWNAGLQRELYESRVCTTLLLRDAISRLHKGANASQLDAVKPRSFVVVTGIGYYKPDRNVVQDESSSGGDFDFLSRLVTDWESAANFGQAFKPKLNFDGELTTKLGKVGSLESQPDVPVSSVSLRTGVVLGADGGAFKEMSMQFKYGLGAYFGDGTQPLPFIHNADLANMILFAIRRFGSEGKTETDGKPQLTVMNAVAPNTCSNREFSDALARAFGYRRAYLFLPNFLLNWVFGPERAVVFTDGQLVKPKKALELGFSFQFPDIESATRDLTAQGASK